VIRFIAAPVNMIGTGWVGSAATHLYLAVPEGAALLHAQHALPDPPALRRRGRSGQRHRHPRAGDHQGARARWPAPSPRDGAPLDKVLEDIERDRWLSAEEAIEYGLVGRIVNHRARSSAEEAGRGRAAPRKPADPCITIASVSL
jgi:ATP-dependent Clp protease protease subunit